MQALLTLKDLWSAVCGTEGDVPDKQDRHGKAYLILNVSPQHLKTVKRAKTAREAWKVLHDTYTAQSTARRLLLKRELSTLAKLPAETTTVYLRQTCVTSCWLQVTTSAAKSWQHLSWRGCRTRLPALAGELSG